ncbi:MAG: hypothetical protein AB7I09_07975 [Planctomycetota bacterium]
MPREIGCLPGSPLGVFYMKSPNKTLADWAGQVLSRLEADNPARHWVEQQCVRGGKPILTGFDGPMVIGVYGNPQTDVEPSFVLLTDPQAGPALTAWLKAGLGAASMGASEHGSLALEQFAIEGGGGGWYQGTVAGFWGLSTDPEMLVQVAAGARGTATIGPFQSGWNYCASLDPDVFMTVDLRHALTSLPDPALAQALGVGNLKGFTYAFKGDGERFMDSLYVHTPAPHKGLLKLFDGERLTEKSIRAVPDASLSFMMFGIDLRALWQDLRLNLPPEVGAQANMIEQQLGFSLEQDLLGSIGSGWSSYGFDDSASPVGLGSVVRIPMRDAARFMACLQKLSAGVGMTLQWKTGPDGFKCLTVPGLDPSFAPTIAAGSQEWVVASSAKAFDKWRSIASTTGNHPAAANLGKRYGGRATWLGYADATAFRIDQNQVAKVAEAQRGLQASVGQLFDLPALGSLPWAQIEKGGQKLLGNMVFAVAPGSDGVEFCFESSCGIFPFLGLGAVVAVRQGQEAERLRRLHVIEARVATAQSEFRGRHGRFARNLWELRDAALIDQGLASGVDAGLLYRIESDGRRWKLEFRDEDSAAVFQLDENLPASERSGIEKDQ